MGWYDANPVHLNKLPPETAAKKLVEYLPSMETVLVQSEIVGDVDKIKCFVQSLDQLSRGAVSVFNIIEP